MATMQIRLMPEEVVLLGADKDEIEAALAAVAAAAVVQLAELLSEGARPGDAAAAVTMPVHPVKGH